MAGKSRQTLSKSDEAEEVWWMPVIFSPGSRCREEADIEALDNYQVQTTGVFLKVVPECPDSLECYGSLLEVMEHKGNRSKQRNFSWAQLQ